MSKMPVFSGKDLIKILLKFGFEVVRIKGSHHFLRHSDSRCTTIPVHRNEEVSPGLLAKILKDCELTINDLTQY